MNETKRTLKERKFIGSYINNNGNATEAYLQAINDKVNKNTAGVLGLRMLRKVKIEVESILDRIGLNDVYLAKKLKEGLETRNLSIRVRYLDMAYKLKDIYPTEKQEVKDEPHVVFELVGGFIKNKEGIKNILKNKLKEKVDLDEIVEEIGKELKK